MKVRIETIRAEPTLKMLTGKIIEFDVDINLRVSASEEPEITYAQVVAELEKKLETS